MNFAYNLIDGHVCIVYGAEGVSADDVMERSIPKDAVDVIKLPDDWTPPDRSHRADWRIVKGEVVVQKV